MSASTGSGHWQVARGRPSFTPPVGDLNGIQWGQSRADNVIFDAVANIRPGPQRVQVGAVRYLRNVFDIYFRKFCWGIEADNDLLESGFEVHDGLGVVKAREHYAE
jgi:hypothetical protein